MTYRQAALSILKSRGQPMSLEELAQKILEIKPSRSKNPIAMVQQALREREFLRFPDGKWGLETWVLNGSVFRIVPTEEELEPGELIISHDLLCFFFHLLREQKRADDGPCVLLEGWDKPLVIALGDYGLLNARILGVDKWFRHSGFEAGDSILVKVRDAEEGRFAFQREPRGERKEDLIQQLNQEFADLAYKFMGGSNYLSSFGNIIPLALAAKPHLAQYPPDPYYDILLRDRRFQIEPELPGLIRRSNAPILPRRDLTPEQELELEDWEARERLKAIFVGKDPARIPDYLDFLSEYMLYSSPDDPELTDLVHSFPLRAERLFRELLVQEPDNMDAFVRLVFLLQSQGRHQEAWREIQERLKLAPQEALVHYVHAVTLRREGDKRGALDAFRKALALDSENPGFHLAIRELEQELEEERKESRQVGRNDPCPCGSGKKYKRCCLLVDQEVRSLREATDRAIAKLGQFAYSPRFHEDLDEAFYLFWAEEYEPDELPGLSEAEQVRFAEWYLFDFPLGEGGTIVEKYLEEQGYGLSSLERRALEDRLGSSMALYEVVEVEPGRGLRVRDVFSGEEQEVKEKKGSQALVKWDLILTRIVPMGNYHVICGAIYFFPVRFKDEVLDFAKKELSKLRRKHKGASWEDLFKERGYRFNHLWMAIAEAPTLPKLVTVESHPVLFSKAIYRVYNAEEVRRRLAHIPGFELSEGEDFDEEEIQEETQLWREAAERDEGDGRRKFAQDEVTYDWLVPRKPGEGYFGTEHPKIMGYVVLKSSRLALECMSKERLEQGKALLEHHLGEYIEHLADSFQDVDAAREEWEEKQEKQEKQEKEGPRPSKSKDVSPEVQQELRRIMEEHHQKWIDQPVPALGGKTPREAVRSKRGKKKVEELLKFFENIEERRRRAGESWYDVNKLRKMLGLRE
ncbi:hypothetical protein HKBW3S44_00417 [Candidatus Hakubella thermalkaliphila]|uniref:HTH HARE-type domain-containing protein n=2 Tax=Candidatus Hakubella thermalkaliphila TaxID=2754717 RepID=A0A6V8PCY7_9ACTN|nr:winged helix-turn-helix domain-containing protein [Candidatus Hakubella thermalkaliphila]GFP30158.1 hypothetical protein HKBW3S34_01078 [Candidatus Hakubella thermalkaliphila]GFP36736.1 hypothetical protein HKBW3S44_00417 [Candidatus Hakubella thermalkaliphila]GFP39092.1 hypothetical protein HKBW3S47_00792 [Candidatus Hakubella thermalkaliphila]